MARKCYEKYEYVDPDNEYTYPNSSVLINKFKMKDEKQAEELEHKRLLVK